MTKLVSLEATIPVLQYGNVRPVVEAESAQEALQFISDIANRVGNKEFASVVLSDDASNASNANGASVSNTKNSKYEVKQFKDTKVAFYPSEHVYKTKAGEWLSGSNFAKYFVKDFPKDFLAKKVAEKAGLTTDDVVKLWDTKGEVSTSFGTAVHAALENKFRFDAFANNLGGQEKVMSNVPYINDLVNQVWDVVKPTTKDKFEPEFFVADKDERLCGVVDLLRERGGKYRIYDYKTNEDIDKPIAWKKGSPYSTLPATMFSTYKLQLSFYAYILKQAGYEVEDCAILWVNDAGVKERVFQPINIKKGLEWMQA